jgi:hypothetical protein
LTSALGARFVFEAYWGHRIVGIARDTDNIFGIGDQLAMLDDPFTSPIIKRLVDRDVEITSDIGA